MFRDLTLLDECDPSLTSGDLLYVIIDTDSE